MGEGDACLGPPDTSGTGISKSNAALVCVGSRELARNRRCGASNSVAALSRQGREWRKNHRPAEETEQAPSPPLPSSRAIGEAGSEEKPGGCCARLGTQRRSFRFLA
ncbi:hypothetical protein OY671_012756 [Metschnikowia pulcherrima]|nr:hypothetical protein OY671_012756 [Metschnikowia pulcherrima]